jgi:hypothetical protein
VAGRRIAGPEILHDGDQIGLADESLVFRTGEDETATV